MFPPTNFTSFLFLQKHIFLDTFSNLLFHQSILIFHQLNFHSQTFFFIPNKIFNSAIIFSSHPSQNNKISCTFNRIAKNELQTFPFFKFQITNSSDIIFFIPRTQFEFFSPLFRLFFFSAISTKGKKVLVVLLELILHF